MPPRKRAKSLKGGKGDSNCNPSRDMISALPDPILCHILSFLPTKYSVRTSALSTRWKYLFTEVPVLDLNDEQNREEPIEDIYHSSFTNFVYRVLLLHNFINTRKFSITCSENNEMDKASHLYSLVSTAIRRNIPEIFVNADLRWQVPLPLDVCTSKTLVKLKLEGCGLELTLSNSMCLPSLKVLHVVDGCIILGKSEQLRFSACPVLEDLNLENCRVCSDGLEDIDISVSSLKRLKFRLDSYASSIVLNTPALKFLEYDHDVNSTISGNLLESLIQARITAYRNFGHIDDGVQDLIQMVSNAYSLSLSGQLMEANALSPTGSEFPRYQNLTRLEFWSAQKTGWKMLPEFLKNSPYLETLIFLDGFTDYIEDALEVDHVLPVHECTCLSLYLKEIEFRCFLGVECEFKLVEYFLKNAKVLNKMIICSTKPLESRYMISQRLLALPRYSRDCLVFVHNKYY